MRDVLARAPSIVLARLHELPPRLGQQFSHPFRSVVRAQLPPRVAPPLLLPRLVSPIHLELLRISFLPHLQTGVQHAALPYRPSESPQHLRSLRPRKMPQTPVSPYPIHALLHQQSVRSAHVRVEVMRLGRQLLGVPEHFGGAVDSEDVVSERGEVEGVASRAASQVDHRHVGRVGEGGVCGILTVAQVGEEGVAAGVRREGRVGGNVFNVLFGVGVVESLGLSDAIDGG
mmetsp:Transcript_33522/g.61616  ORF Transcript_33522/g.61616 Transcript_33522/m.61616 type:complete len:230 (-) Transcript_33522:925-1614(-)